MCVFISSCGVGLVCRCFPVNTATSSNTGSCHQRLVNMLPWCEPLSPLITVDRLQFSHPSDLSGSKHSDSIWLEQLCWSVRSTLCVRCCITAVLGLILPFHFNLIMLVSCSVKDLFECTSVVWATLNKSNTTHHPFQSIQTLLEQKV